METFLTILGIATVFLIARYFVFISIPFVYFYKLFPKKYAPHKIQSKEASNSQIHSEIQHSIISSVAFALVGAVVSFSPFKNYTLIYNNSEKYAFWWIPVSLLIAFIIHDTYFYWMHRIFHHPKLFKFTHLIHHKSTNPSPWASYSFNITEAFAEAFILVILACILPMHKIAIFIFAFTSFLINVYGHLGYEIAPRWFRNSFLFKIMNTSVYHNMHHSKFKGNYSLYFRFWDRVMKTELPNYEQVYDEIQERRFPKKIQGNYTSKAAIILLLLIPSIGISQIEGKWIDKSTGAVVQIYKEEGMYVGRAIKAGNPTEDKKLEGKKLIILKNFEPKGYNKWCCGDIFLPRMKIYAKGSITLLNASMAKVTGRYLAFSKSFIWHKIE